MTYPHNRQTSVASFASSLYLPVDPDDRPNLDDESDAYPSSDELFGPDHEEGDDYTISSRRYLSSYSRYSPAFSHMSHPPTPPRSTRSTMSLGRTSSSSLTPPQSRHSNIEPSCSPSAWTNRPVPTVELPSPPSTARSSNETHMSSSLDKYVASQSQSGQGVPIEKFEQLAFEHLEQDKALLQMLRKLDNQRVRIAQLTYALSRLRILSNSTCLIPGSSDAPMLAGSSSVLQVRCSSAIIPKPLIVQQLPKSAGFTTSCSTVLSATRGTSGLSGPSTNEAVNQRRRAKQQLHEFALRRFAQTLKGRVSGKPPVENAVTRARRGGWEGARGSPSLALRETKPQGVGAIGHPNVTVRRPKRPDPAPRPTKQSTTQTPKPSVPASALTVSPSTPPRLLSLFSSPSTATSRSPRTPTQTRHIRPALYGSPSTPVLSRKNKDKPLPLRPVSPTKPVGLARNVSYKYQIPPVPSPDRTIAHVTLVDRSQTASSLSTEEVRSRLAATFAHFSKSRAPSPPREPITPRRALEYPMLDPPPLESDYLEQMLHHKWVAQLDEHSHQARGSWKSPLKAIKQKIAGGFGIARKPSRASLGDSSSEAHSHSHAHSSFEAVPVYVHGLGTVREGSVDLEHGGEPGNGDWMSPGTIDHKGRKLKRKGGGKEEGSGGVTKPPWRFSRQASSAS